MSPFKIGTCHKFQSYGKRNHLFKRYTLKNITEFCSSPIYLTINLILWVNSINRNSMCLHKCLLLLVFSVIISITNFYFYFQNGAQKRLPIMLCANKTDLRSEMETLGRRVVKFEDGQRLSRVSTTTTNLSLSLSLYVTVELFTVFMY